MAQRKPKAETADKNPALDYEVLKKFPFNGKRYETGTIATLTPSQAAYFISNGNLKLKGAK
ncbi:hypothetical protein G6Z94_11785 [Vibrio aestuarianus]|uniref:hypothetical protein n=1 Tax=Vibrio aestuarianus TaxID=28171 RepID=UPI001594B576|nr:hypothetical protein [Vibrio aestuarianus]NGZ18020.1 hypothetical protein [Vibrio aestuarianus]